MGRILLARHGETAWNALGRLQGHTDIELNDVGRAQAQSLGEAIASTGVTSVWTSDLARARQTGAIVAEALRLAPPQIDPELRERKFGVFEGLTREQCASEHPEAWQAWLAQTGTPPGGEPRQDVTTRLTRALARIVASTTEPTLVVSHGGVMRLWLMEVTGAPVPLLGNGATYVIDHEAGRFRAALLPRAATR
jgi:broad specificity phosphatase PhoE